MTIIFILPTVRPVAGDTMNYAIVFLAFVLLAAAVYWFIGGRKFYTGPLTEADIIDGTSASSGDGSSPVREPLNEKDTVA